MKASSLYLFLGSVFACMLITQQAHAAGFNEYRPEPAFSETVTTSQYVTMRDGVKIALQLVRPAVNGKAAEGRFPVIWQAGLSLPGPPREGVPVERALGDWTRLVKQGYVIVDVARRAHGPSFGVRRSYHDREEAYDAYEITEWLAAQPWSNGNVGIHGCSNTGEAVMHAMTVAPPHLKAAWAGCFSWTKYDAVLRGGGIIANWGSGPTRTLEQDMAERPVDGDEGKTLLAKAAQEHLLSVDLFELMKTIPYRDSFSPLTRSRFAVEGSAGTYAAQLKNANIPLYIQEGWYDDFRKDGFIALANMTRTHLVIGPWTHCANDDFDLIAEAQRFFDYYLKGIETGIEAGDHINYFVVGERAGQEWKSVPSWPSVNSNAQNLYFDNTTLNATHPDAGKAELVADYQVSCAAQDDRVTVLQQPCHPSKGAVSFSGPVLQQATEFTGHPLVKIWASSSNTSDARLFVYLEDVAPDGTVSALTEGRQQLALRKTTEPPWEYYDLPWHRSFAEDEQLLQHDVPVEVVIDMLPISRIVPAGHRIQISVSGSDARERIRNEAIPPQLTIYYGGTMASMVSLPLR